jgi:hypothetical protein
MLHRQLVKFSDHLAILRHDGDMGAIATAGGLAVGGRRMSLVPRETW